MTPFTPTEIILIVAAGSGITLVFLAIAAYIADNWMNWD